MEESRQEISVQFVSEIGEASFPPLKHQSIDSETTLSIDYQPQAVSRVSGGTGAGCQGSFQMHLWRHN